MMIWNKSNYIIFKTLILIFIDPLTIKMATKEILKFELIKFNNKSYQVSAIVFNVIHHMLSVIRKNIKYITLCFNVSNYKKLSSILDAKMFSDEI